ncbi:hypothetical protein BWI17_13045 [Betaproteobacteria bacterium GR16-43]|nr:hypothetical protein BWI17_13045 [Betaproteobacteria bacterium GR16-43]
MNALPRALRCLATLLLLTLSLDAAAQAFAGDLVRRAAAKRTVAPAPFLADASRTRPVEIDREAIAKAGRALLAKRAEAPLLNIAFFDDVVTTVEITGSERTQGGGTALVGRIAGDPASSAVIVDNGGALTVLVAGAQGRFSLHGSAERGYVAAQVTKDLVPTVKSDEARVPEWARFLEKSGKAKRAPTAGAKVERLEDDGNTIDVMVLYTQAVSGLYQTIAQLEAVIDAQVALTNLVYQNSNVKHRIRLVYKGYLPYLEADVRQDLYRLNDKTHLSGGSVQILRDAYRADLVSVWGAWPQVCGIAFVGDAEVHAMEAYATSLVNAPSCTGAGSYTFAHELGHSMYLSHNREQYAYPFPQRLTPEGSRISVDVGYAHGYLDDVNRFYTVMSYPGAVSGARVPYFSNPNLTFDNRAFYPGAAANAPLGDAVLAHEQHALDDTRETVANYRVSLEAVNVPGTVIFRQPYQPARDTDGSVTLKVARVAGDAGTVLATYTTVPGTALPGVHYTPVTGQLSWGPGDDTEREVIVPIAAAVSGASKTFTVSLATSTAGAYAGGQEGLGANIAVVIEDDQPDPFPGTQLPAGFTSTHSAGNPWSADTKQGFTSTTSLQSGLVYPGTSDLNYSDIFAGGNVTFVFKMSSSEGGASSFEFSIDGAPAYVRQGGETPWTFVSIYVPPGQHALRWRFTNSGTEPSYSEDRMWVDEITLPSQPAANISHLAYIANTGVNTLSAIDVRTNNVVSTLPVCASPKGVAVHPNGLKAYVVCSSGSVAVVDTVMNTVIKTLSPGSNPHSVAVTPDGTRAYVTHFNLGQVSVIDTATDTLLPPIPATGASGIDINRAGTRAYVSRANGSEVHAIDLTTGTSLGSVLWSFNPYNPIGIAVAQDTNKVYSVANQNGNVKIYDANTNTYPTWIAVGGQPVGIALHDGTRRGYVTTGTGGTLAVVDLNTNGVIAQVPVGSGYGVAVTADGGRAYVLDGSNGTVKVVDTNLLQVIATVSVGSSSAGLGKFIKPATVAAPPTDIIAGPGNENITLTFPATVNDGGMPVIRYEATCQPGNVTASATGTTIVVNGLANGVASSCTVRTVNARGTGPASAVASATPNTGTTIMSANATTFTVLSAGSFRVTTSGVTPTSYTATGTLPAGVALSAGGFITGAPASGTAGVYPFTINAMSGASVAGTQSFTLTVAKIPQAITYEGFPTMSETGAPVTLAATGGGSGNPVTFTSGSLGVCTVSGNVVTMVDGGVCVILADQAGSTDYSAAPQRRSDTTIRFTQTVAFAPALPASSGLNTAARVEAWTNLGVRVATYVSTPDTCSQDNSYPRTLYFNKPGTCTVYADGQAASSVRDAAPRVYASVTVLRGIQPLAFINNGPMQIGVAVAKVPATSNSIYPTQLTTSTPSICSVSGVMVTALQFGTCTLTATVPGDATWETATITGSFSSQLVMSVNTVREMTVKLNDGRVMVAGSPYAAPAAIYDPVTVQWTALPPMVSARERGAAVVLDDGRVLVAGGRDWWGTATTAHLAEVYNPATNAWSPAGSMSTARVSFTLTKLADGRVLAAGGIPGLATALADLYDPATNTWSPAAPMAQSRGNHTATLLPDGRVLVIGGLSAANVYRTLAEVYDPANNTWSGHGTTDARASHAAVLMPDGKVLVAGGTVYNQLTNATAYLYDTATGAQTAAGSLTVPRADHGIVRMADGRVMVAGGSNGGTTTEIYDPVQNQWATSTQLVAAHNPAALTLLDSGAVLVSGGGTAEVWSQGLLMYAPVFPNARLAWAYGPFTLGAGGGTQPFSFAVTGGSLPPGVTLSTAGVLQGTPSQLGTFNFTVTLTDAASLSSSRAMTIVVDPVAFTVTPSAGPNGGINPNYPRTVTQGATTTFIVGAVTGYSPTVGGTCGGSLSGATYTTAPITADCTVAATFTQVAFPPSAPTGVSAVAGNYSAVVTFTPPANNGGMPVSLYTAICEQQDMYGGTMATVQATGYSSPVTVTGLNSGRATYCKVLASNAMGAGPASAWSNMVVPTVPLSTVNVSVPTGVAGGTVTSTDPAGAYNCPGDCTEQIIPGSYVTLVATPAAGRLFSGWVLSSGMMCNYEGGGASGGNNTPTCRVQIGGGGTTTITAVFVVNPTQPTAPFLVDIWAGVGTVNARVLPKLGGGTPITGYTMICYAITAPTVPVGTVTSPTTSITMSGLTPGIGVKCKVAAVNAVNTGAYSEFTTPVVPLTGSALLSVAKAGTGAGTVTSDIVGINCGTDCEEPYSLGQIVTLTASPTVGSTFTGWSGGTGSASCTGTGPCTITIGASSSITATFTPPVSYSVTSSAGAHGSIAPASTQTVPYNTPLTFTVTPDFGYVPRVGGTCGGSLVGTTFTTPSINGNCTVAVTFEVPSEVRMDFDASAKSDILWRHTDGTHAIWLMDGTTIASSANIFPAGTAWQVAFVTDLSGDGKSDLVWQNPDGRVTVYLMDGLTAPTKVNLFAAAAGWTVSAVGDLNGDGKADLLLKNTDGTVSAALMDGGTITTQGTLLAAGSGWTVVKTADFDGDGKDDLVLVHTDGSVQIALMDGLTTKSSATVMGAGSGWTLKEAVDTDGDGKADLVWQHTDGTVGVWLMHGLTTAASSTLLGPGTGWVVTRAGDFNADGRIDLLLENTDGRAAICLMDGATIVAPIQILNGGGWSVKRVQDMNADGKADIVWQNADGRVAVWLMNGAVVVSGLEVLGAGTGWSVSTAGQ